MITSPHLPHSKKDNQSASGLDSSNKRREQVSGGFITSRVAMTDLLQTIYLNNQETSRILPVGICHHNIRFTEESNNNIQSLKLNNIFKTLYVIIGFFDKFYIVGANPLVKF